MNKLEEKLERLESLEDRANDRVERKAIPDGTDAYSFGEGHSDGRENHGTDHKSVPKIIVPPTKLEESSFEEEYSTNDEECSTNDEECSEDDDESISSEDLKAMGESLQAYQEMVATNWENWTYPESRYSRIPDLEGYEAHDAYRVVGSLKKSTIKMRRGEYHSDRGRNIGRNAIDIGRNAIDHDFQGVNLEPCENELNEAIPYHIALKPHWKEFANALDDYELILDIMPHEAEPCFQISQIQLPVNIFKMIMKSLEGKSFEHYKFENNDFERHGILAIIDLLDSNEYLRSLTLSKNLIDEEDEGDFCEAIVSHPALKGIDLNECCEGRTFILRELVQSSLLLHISMSNDDLRFVSREERQAFADALVSNTHLITLYLTEIHLNDEDLACFKTVLESNSTLTVLCLAGSHRFTEAAKENFGKVLRTNNTLKGLCVSGIKFHNGLFDDSSLNSAADSNHTCYVDCHFKDICNEQNDPKGNRQRKIYNILARRHLEMSNVQHFDDIDIKQLPDILAAVQRYAIDPPFGALIFEVNREVKSLSIIFEIMRKWDKALSLYKTLGDNM